MTSGQCDGAAAGPVLAPTAGACSASCAASRAASWRARSSAMAWGVDLKLELLRAGVPAACICYALYLSKTLRLLQFCCCCTGPVVGLRKQAHSLPSRHASSKAECKPPRSRWQASSAESCQASA